MLGYKGASVGVMNVAEQDWTTGLHPEGDVWFGCVELDVQSRCFSDVWSSQALTLCVLCTLPADTTHLDITGSALAGAPQRGPADLSRRTASS